MTSAEIRGKFLKFFAERGHTVVPSSSLVPDDPSVLLTTAGMQQFKPYYADLDPTVTVHPTLGKPVGLNACSAQKCFRTSDIDEVGDDSHLTFFEMLGNFSFGGYFKEEAIGYAHEFITKVMGLPISYVTVFKGSASVPKDDESRAIWNSLGVADVREEGMEDVFWGPTGNSGPCGPTTEIYVKTPAGKDVEVWNIVFNEFLSSSSREDLLAGRAALARLPTPGVDTGMGFERLVIMVQKAKSIYETDVFARIFGDWLANANAKSARISADHLRSACFLLADGILPSNKDRGYVLRRILRRLIVHSQKIGLAKEDLSAKIQLIAAEYAETYPELEEKSGEIAAGLSDEYERFSKTLSEGLKKYEKLLSAAKRDPQAFDATMAKAAFDLYQSSGLPMDVTFDLIAESGVAHDDPALRAAASALFAGHQETSKAGVAGKFGGHGLVLTGELKAGNDEEVAKVTRLHTATHLLHAALRRVLGPEVKQMGSDITPERLRFDFAYGAKLTGDQIAAVEKLVNDEIIAAAPVAVAEMPFADAQTAGALAFFKGKYPATVKVYSIGDFSKEVCGGPHVHNTNELGEFKIVKDEAVSAGIRRIRATVKP